MTIKAFESWCPEHWPAVKQKLLDGTYLRAGVMVEGVLQPTDEGALQGGPLSPFLSNILLDDLDKELERRRLKFVRYADDFVIFVRSERSAVRVFASVQRYLTQHLKLVVNEQKSSVRPARGCEFLGFAFVGQRVTITTAPKKHFNRKEDCRSSSRDCAWQTCNFIAG